MTLRLSAFCLRSHRTQRCLECTGKRSRENEMDCMGKQVSVGIGAQFHARYCMRNTICYSIRLEMGNQCGHRRTGVVIMLSRNQKYEIIIIFFFFFFFFFNARAFFFLFLCSAVGPTLLQEKLQLFSQ